jgi:hypothetical protein
MFHSGQPPSIACDPDCFFFCSSLPPALIAEELAAAMYVPLAVESRFQIERYSSSLRGHGQADLSILFFGHDRLTADKVNWMVSAETKASKGDVDLKALRVRPGTKGGHGARHGFPMQAAAS